MTRLFIPTGVDTEGYMIDDINNVLINFFIFAFVLVLIFCY